MSYLKGLESRTLRAEFDFLYLITQERGSLWVSLYWAGESWRRGREVWCTWVGSGQHERVGYCRDGGRGKRVGADGTADSRVNRQMNRQGTRAESRGGAWREGEACGPLAPRLRQWPSTGGTRVSFCGATALPVPRAPRLESEPRRLFARVFALFFPG